MKNKVFFIAEAGINHNGSLSKAKKLVDIAVKCKADAVKFQFYKTDQLASKFSNNASYQKKNIKDKTSHYEMLNKYELSNNDLYKLKNYCKNKIKIMVTPFDLESLDFIKKKKFPLIKISSGDNDNYAFLESVSKINATIFISTGMINLQNLKKSIKILKKNNNKIYILHCVSIYPTPLDLIHLDKIRILKKKFPNFTIGFSDHTQEIQTPSFAVIKGAKVIEKHFTYNKMSQGPDHKFSLSPKELASCIEMVRMADKIKECNFKKTVKLENEIAKISKKRILAKNTIYKNQIITLKNILFKRSSKGKFASEVYNLINKKSKKKYLPNEPI